MLHAKERALEPWHDSVEALCARLAGELGFDVALPARIEPTRVVGGRACTLAGRPVAFFSLRGERTRATLVQFRRNDFEGVEVERLVDGPRVADVWFERARGYAQVVEELAGELESLGHTPDADE